MADESGPSPVVYQVPMTYRAAPLLGAEGALIGTTEHGVLGTRWVYDAPHDDVFVDRLLALIQGQAEPQAQSESNTPDPTVAGPRGGRRGRDARDVRRHAWRAVQHLDRLPGRRRRPVPPRNRSSSRCSGRCTPARTPTSSSSPRSPRRGPPRSRTPSATSPASGPTRSPANGFADTWPSPSGSSRESRTRGGSRSGRPPPERTSARPRASSAPPRPTSISASPRRWVPFPRRTTPSASWSGSSAPATTRRSLRCRRCRPTRTSSPRRSTTSPPASGPTCSGSTATTTSARCSAPRTAGSPSTSRASRSGRCTSGSRPDLALRDVAGMLRSFDYVGGSVELERARPLGSRLGGGDPHGLPRGVQPA